MPRAPHPPAVAADQILLRDDPASGTAAGKAHPRSAAQAGAVPSRSVDAARYELSLYAVTSQWRRSLILGDNERAVADLSTLDSAERQAGN